ELLGAGSVVLPAANNVGTLAACTGGSINYDNGGALTIGTVNSTVGVQTANQDITLVTGGNLTLNQKLDAATGAAACGGSIFLNVTGCLTQSPTGVVNGNGLEAIATTSVLLTFASNDVVRIASRVTALFNTYLDA